MRKSKKYFISILSLAFLIITSLVFSLILFSTRGLLSSILTFFSLVGLFILLKLKNTYDYLKHEEIFKDLLNGKKKPFKAKNKLSSEHITKKLLNNLNFIHFKTTGDYSLYYKLDKGSLPKSKKQALFAVIILNNINFASDVTTTAFEQLEKELSKKNKYIERFFYQFKETNNNFSKEIISEADQIFFLSLRNQKIILLNILFDMKSNYVYYLNSDNQKPYYITFAYDFLEKIIK